MILDEIAAKTRERVARCKENVSPEEMKKKALSLPSETGFPFEKQLKKDGVSFICEIKKASPSKGVIAEHFPYLDIAAEYEKIGADCISVLTEPDYFMGSTEYLKEIHEKVDVPLLRKDFTVDEYMIYEAKVIGASVRAGARIIGVNNRNLKTFEVDINNCIRQRKHIPSDILFVAESGIKSREDVAALEKGGVDGVLIGETLMRSPDKEMTLRQLKGR